MPTLPRAALQLAVALCGVAAGVLLVAKGRQLLHGRLPTASAAAALSGSELDARFEAAGRELVQLKLELERTEDARSEELIAALGKSYGSFEDGELVGRLRARDVRVREALEAAARSAKTATRAAWLESVLFVGTGEARRLEQVFEARALPDEADWTEIVLDLQLDSRLSDRQRARILEEIDRLARSDRAAALHLLEHGFRDAITREDLADPAALDRMVALAREGVLAGQVRCLASLPYLSADAAIATAATFLADSARDPELRGQLLEELATARLALPDDRVADLPEGETPSDWQTWIDAHPLLVERAMAIGR